jgi:hypothetical protein
MRQNVLPFPAHAATTARRNVVGAAAKIISFADHKKSPRALRVATGVYFVSSYPVSLSGNTAH